MKHYYLLANGQPNDRAIYYTGEEDFHGGELWGNINDAYKFERIEDVFEYLKKDGGYSTSIIVRIADVTIDRCLKGYQDIMSGNNDTDEARLMHKYNTVSYITNSER